MKKALIKYSSITLAFVIVLFGVFSVVRFATADDGNPNIKIAPDATGEYDLCDHDDSYVEPTLKEGKYYLDGDTSKISIEIKDGYILYKAASPEDYAALLFTVDIEEVKETAIESYNKQIEHYSQNYQYKVHTYHQLSDTVSVLEKWSEDDSGVSGIGYTLIDENTLQLNDYTRFIYVEQ